MPQAVTSEKKQIFFLKSHKCASTTIQNILMRFGHKENLDFLLPNKNNYVGNPIHFNTSMVVNNNYSTTDGQYDMFVHHTRYSQDIKYVMRPGTVYVTILREPTTLFQSIYSFYHFEKKYKTNLTEFIANNLMDTPSTVKHVRRYRSKIGLNQMSWDLGMDTKDFDDTKLINKHINMVEKDFDFVMIFEYFDASLVLLADLMCWPLEQMAYLPLNTRSDSLRPILSDHDVNWLKKLNTADSMLYDRFLQKFKEKINGFGVEKLKSGMAKLMAINQEITENCVEATTNHGYARTVSYKLKEKSNTICKYIAMNELTYTSFLREMQYERQKKYKTLDKLMNDY